MLKGNSPAPAQKHWEQLLKMIQSGELEPLNMVGHRVLLEEVDKRMPGMQKVFVQTMFSSLPCKGPPKLTAFK
jgi:threonine dehydrogenase-like Zn-dependent dehydrogenase